MYNTEVIIPVLKPYKKEFEYITKYAVDNNSIDSTGLIRYLEINITPAKTSMVGWYNDITITIGGVKYSDTMAVSDLLLGISMMSDYLNAIISRNEEAIGAKLPFMGKYRISMDYLEGVSLYSVYIKEDDNNHVHVLHLPKETLIEIREDLEILRRSLSTINAEWISRYIAANIRLDEKYNEKHNLMIFLVGIITMLSIGIYNLTFIDLIPIIGLTLNVLIVAFGFPKRK